MNLRIIKSYREIVTLCDKELIGKYFEQNKLQLDIKENFYKGDEINEEKAIEILKNMSREDATFNIVGKESIKTAIKAKIISEENIGEIQGIPFSLVLI